MIKQTIFFLFVFLFVTVNVSTLAAMSSAESQILAQRKAENDRKQQMYWLKEHGTPIRTILGKDVIEWYPACLRKRDNQIFAYRSWGVVKVYKDEDVVTCPDFF